MSEDDFKDKVYAVCGLIFLFCAIWVLLHIAAILG